VTGITSAVINDFTITDDFRNLYAATDNYIINYKFINENTDLKYDSKLLTDESGNIGLRAISSIISTHDGKNLYTFSYSNFFPSGISVYSHFEDGHISYLENYSTKNKFFGVGLRYSILLSPDDKYLYAAGKDIYCFKRNNIDGKLTLFEKINFSDIGAGDLYKIDHLSISKDGKSLVCISNEKKAILSFYRNISDGKLLLKQRTHFSENNDYATAFPKSAFSHDLKELYIISQYDKTMSAFKTHVPLGLIKSSVYCADSVNLIVDKGYTYLWSNGDTANSITVKYPGQYTVHVKDSIGREGWDTTNVIAFHPALKIDVFKDTLFSSEQNILLNSRVIGGTPPFQYHWNDGSFAVNKTVNFSNLSDGSYMYTLSVTDDYGCKDSDSITIKLNRTGVEDYQSETDKISIYPNPFDNFLTIQFGDKLNDFVTIQIYDLNGRNLYYSGRVSEKIYRMDLSWLIPGAYIIDLSSKKYKNRMIINKR
jgi:hypothetical protein